MILDGTKTLITEFVACARAAECSQRSTILSVWQKRWRELFLGGTGARRVITPKYRAQTAKQSIGSSSFRQTQCIRPDFLLDLLRMVDPLIQTLIAVGVECQCLLVVSTRKQDLSYRQSSAFTDRRLKLFLMASNRFCLGLMGSRQKLSLKGNVQLPDTHHRWNALCQGLQLLLRSEWFQF